MCSRLGYATRGNLFYPTFRLGLIKLLAREVIFPSQTIYTVLQGTDEVGESNWGLLPHQLGGVRTDPVQDKKGLIINSRRESLPRVWNRQFKSARCVVLASHYFEYRAEMRSGKPQKVPYRFALADAPEFAMAGLFAMEPEGKQTFATIITVPASEQTQDYHDRMPAILQPGQIEHWLSPQADSGELMAMLVPFTQLLTIAAADRAQLVVPRAPTAHIQSSAHNNETLDFPD